MGRYFDVVVVGAGPAGSALSILLARRGLRVAILDRAEFPRDKVCGDFVNARALRQLLALGVYDDLTALDATPIRRASTYLDDSCLGTHDLPLLDGAPPYNLTIPRRELDEALFRTACAAGAIDYQGTSFRDIEHHATGCTVIAEHAGRIEKFHTRLVVGADGAESAVAKATGLAMRDRRYVIASERAYCHGLDLDETIVAFSEAEFPGFSWIFPVRPGLANVGAGMLAEPARHFGYSLRAQYQSFLGFLRRFAAERGAHIEVESPRGWPIKVFGGGGRTTFEHGLLVGEAASTVDPVSGEGIPLALESALQADGVISAALERGTLSPPALTSAMPPRMLDLRINDLLVTLTRNHHLKSAFLAGLRGAAAIARLDPGYASVVGGVFAGLTPSSQLLAPRVGLMGFVHAAAATRAAIGVDAGASPATIVERAWRLQRTQVEGARRSANDAEWLREWLLDLADKQKDLFAELLAGRPRG